MLDEETIERIVETVLRRLLVELAPPGGGPPRLSAREAARARASLGSSTEPAPPPPRARLVTHRHPGRLLSEDELVAYFRRGIRSLELEPHCIVTPSARDRSRDLQVDLVVG